MKRILLSCLTALIATALFATELDLMEKCNNLHRHYCRDQRQAVKVDAELLRMKESGYHITEKMIRYIAQKHLGSSAR